MALILSNEAYKDLKNISDFISQDSTSRAKKFINELFQELEKIEENPLIFRKSIYFNSNRYRDKIFKKYTIVFRIDEVDIYVLAIFKGRNYKK